MISPSSVTLHRISTSIIKPPPSSLDSRRVSYLTPYDLFTLSMHYIQNGLLFCHPVTLDLIAGLKTALSLTLHHFRPLAGRLVSEPTCDASGGGIQVYVDWNDQGAEFIHASAPHVSAADVASPDVPCFLHPSFFPLNGAVSYDGHSLPLLSTQLTELADGFFLACSFNHSVGDGTAYWHFFNVWAEITRNGGGDGSLISQPPVLDRWSFEGGSGRHLQLPFTHPNQFIERFAPPGPPRERVFHFSSESIAHLKAKANQESNSTVTISSFQSVAALVWRSVTRARGLPAERTTGCAAVINDRTRLQPPLPTEYFGGVVWVVRATAEVGELLERGLGCGAMLVHEAVTGRTDGAVRRSVKGWAEEPFMYPLSLYDRYGVKMGSSARFNVYGCDFGWGQPVAVRSGAANKHDGKVTFHPGREGGGSMDLEICLKPETMEALLHDEEFMSVVNFPA
ncbi:uncharacterized acetyltransferase At3g50280-like isoform X1 [Zingiber officinale]|uniref:Uncharacterized protein n=1 Tax=Zingiber officinale TaxID=94328 RepID=A0A8J5F5H5_ZINOF|nr:uncharacterized acetyltransferase At3g50280-like isoform X1 [Zingiber officinale]KAG6481298.1 hypothetical protein ZIOFF_057894 [Zingiber officinale]